MIALPRACKVTRNYASPTNTRCAATDSEFILTDTASRVPAAGRSAPFSGCQGGFRTVTGQLAATAINISADTQATSAFVARITNC